MPVTGGLELVMLGVGVVVLVLVVGVVVLGVLAAVAAVSHRRRSAQAGQRETKPAEDMTVTPALHPSREIIVAISAAIHRYRASHPLPR